MTGRLNFRQKRAAKGAGPFGSIDESSPTPTRFVHVSAARSANSNLQVFRALRVLQTASGAPADSHPYCQRRKEWLDH